MSRFSPVHPIAVSRLPALVVPDDEHAFLHILDHLQNYTCCIMLMNSIPIFTAVSTHHDT